MPNISLLPGDRDIGLNDIVAATDRGIVIRNRGSWSIDHQRYNFQFSGQAFYEVRDGKIAGMLRDVAYQSNTPVFWNAMDMIGGKSSYWMGGSFNDGKGEPSQIKLGEPRLRAGAGSATSRFSTRGAPHERPGRGTGHTGRRLALLSREAGAGTGRPRARRSARPIRRA